MATAKLEPKSGSAVSGTVRFSDADGGLKIQYDLKNLSQGPHGFHLHEKGDCSSPDAKSAGTHYIVVAPTGGTSLDTPQRFAGDLPQVIADEKGNAKGEVVVPNLSIDRDNPIEGRSIMIHAGPDNPKKKSEPRVACGVVEKT